MYTILEQWRRHPYHLDHVVNSMFDVGEQKVNDPQSVTISDDGNPSCIDDSSDLPNLFVETETLN